jgi:LPXTG-motif cell wall-anchored protein
VLSVCVVGLMTYATSAGAAPKTVRGSATDVNVCDYHVVPFLQPPGDPLSVRVTVSSDAAAQPHDSGPMMLSNTTAEVRIGADFLQPAVEAGVVADGLAMSGTISVTLRGSNTVEATHTFTENVTPTLQVVDGVARPVIMTVSLPNTVWHPDRADTDVVFSEESVRIDLDIELEGIGLVRLVATCEPSAVRPFVVLFGLPTTTTSTTTTTTGIVDPPLVEQATTTAPAANALPRTGTSSGYAVFFGLSCVAAGALLVGRSRKSWIH